MPNNPIQQWNAAIECKTQSGFSKAAAIAAIAREQPQLHRDYLAAFTALHNPPRPGTMMQRQEAPAAAPPQTVANPIATWNEAVECKTQSGFSKAAAIAAVVRENPELHQAYLDAWNATHGRQIA